MKELVQVFCSKLRLYENSGISNSPGNRPVRRPGRAFRFAIRLGVGVWCLAFGVLLFADDDPDDPSAELATFQVADGFEVNLFASEKDGVVKPIQIRFDARGRLWVIGSTVYPQIKPGELPDDKVLIV